MKLTGSQIKIILMMYLGYGSMMISRQMVTILSPAIEDDPELGFGVQETQDILGFGTIGAMVGKLVWGPLADYIGGRLTFLLGIVLTALLIAAFGMSYNLVAFTFFAALSYGTKSSGWPAMTKMVGNWFHPASYGRTWSILSTSSRASVILGTFLFGMLLGYFHWRSVALFAAIAGLGIYVICHIFIQEKPRDPSFLEDDQTFEDPELAREMAGALENKKNHPLLGTSLREGLLAFARSPRVFWVVAMLMALTCAMAFLDFLPLYLKQVYRLPPDQAAMFSIAMPVGSLSGLILSFFFYDRFSKKELRFVLPAMLAVAVACVLFLPRLAQLELGETGTLVSALLLVVVFGIATAPAYYIPMSIFSIEFGGPHAATLVAMIDMFSFAASASLNFTGGRVVEAYGWDSFMLLMGGIAFIALTATFFFMNGEYRAVLREADQAGVG